MLQRGERAAQGGSEASGVLTEWFVKVRAPRENFLKKEGKKKEASQASLGQESSPLRAPFPIKGRVFVTIV